LNLENEINEIKIGMVDLMNTSKVARKFMQTEVSIKRAKKFVDRDLVQELHVRTNGNPEAKLIAYINNVGYNDKKG
jgi:hypothetical protein